ncbi:MAG: MotA/TolQ/ExbB proton channel family protein [bacterium]|nr:MotA/TolQ/ExbB proton channel family protein [bacterium]
MNRLRLAIRSKAFYYFAGIAIVVFAGLISQPTGAHGQEAGPSADPAPAPVDAATAQKAAAAGEEKQLTEQTEPIQLFKLIFEDGGYFMIPIFLLSLVVVTFAIERGIALRREKVMPQRLVDGLSNLGKSGGFDPREAYRLCQQYPSATANVIKAMLLKVGRPHSEVEAAVKDVTDRESDKLYSNVRYVILAAGIAPLMGLLGTVWGMIQAFHDSTQEMVGVNKAEQLAEGIYQALVTTLGGLVVGITAAVIGHFFEGRIQKMMREVSEMLFSLLPQIERYEGRVRFTRQSAEEPGEMAENAAPAPTPPAPAPAAK